MQHASAITAIASWGAIATCVLLSPAAAASAARSTATRAPQGPPVEASAASSASRAVTDRPALLPNATTSFGACRVGSYAYTYGGHIGRAHDHNRNNVLGSFRRLNLIDGRSFEELPPPGPALQGTALVAAPNGMIYRIGGTDARNAPGADEDMHSTASVQRFDVEQGRWLDETPLPEPRSSHDAIVCGKQLYVVGGWELDGEGDGYWHDTAWVANWSEQPLTWRALPALGHARRACAVATFAGKVAVLGGIDEDETLTSVHVFDPADNTWSPGPNLPGFAFGTAAIGVDDWLYATVVDGRLLKWDGKAKDWQPAAQLEMPRFFHRMLKGADPSKLLVLGGAGRGGHMRHVEHIAIDGSAAPELREYVLPAPSQVAYRQALLLHDNVLWAFGGNRGNRGERFAPEQFADDVWKIELATMTASKCTSLPTGSQSMAAIAVRGKGYLLGGLGVANEGVDSLDSGIVWDPRRQQASPLAAKLPVPRTQCQLAEHEGQVYVLGGTDFQPGDASGRRGSTGSNPLDVLVLDPSAESEPTFASSGIELPRARRSFGVAKLHDKLYLIGGLGKGFAHAGCCDVYDFASKTWSELDAPANWVSPQVAAIGERLYVACGGTMKGRSFREDRSLWSFEPTEGWRVVLAELPFPVRHVAMLPHRNRLLFYSTNDRRHDRIVIHTFEPDASVFVAAKSFHR